MILAPYKYIYLLTYLHDPLNVAITRSSVYTSVPSQSGFTDFATNDCSVPTLDVTHDNDMITMITMKIRAVAKELRSNLVGKDADVFAERVRRADIGAG